MCINVLPPVKAARQNGEASPQWVGNVSTVLFIRFN